MSSIYIRTGKGSTNVSHGCDSVSSALSMLEVDIKARRRNGERWDKVTKYHYVRDDGLVMKIEGVSW